MPPFRRAEQQAKVIQLRYGFGQPPLTLVAIAQKLDITPERVRQLERTALRNMRRNEQLSGLEAQLSQFDE